ncbi:hypothetical protein VNO78_09811 [Psophocarpus tetragonolobus]|uniref:Uncharacterized protein n=1 Tax=Psophocarpus tetragonolobus TaxID=3891 RepID=A0AAN9SWT4_PSOTE
MNTKRHSQNPKKYKVKQRKIDVLLKFHDGNDSDQDMCLTINNIKAVILDIFICPGSTFGMINVELTIAILLSHFDWKLPNGMKSEDLDMTEQFGVTVRRKDDLHLIPVTHCPFMKLCSFVDLCRIDDSVVHSKVGRGSHSRHVLQIHV